MGITILLIIIIAVLLFSALCGFGYGIDAGDDFACTIATICLLCGLVMIIPAKFTSDIERAAQADERPTCPCVQVETETEDN